MSPSTHFLGRLFTVALILCGVSPSWLTLSAQTPSVQATPEHKPVSVVSDWTHRHVLYPESKDAAVTEQVKHDPRWMQSWYLNHPEAWWPKRPSGHRKSAHRDWSVPLGTAYFEPLFDSTFTFSLSDGTTTETGSGILTSADLGNGSLLATAGSLTVTGGIATGTYSLYSGGPSVTHSPAGAFQYDNLVFPGVDPVLDQYGLLFLGGGLQVNLWGNSAGNYSFADWVGGTQTTVTGPGSVTPVISANPDPGGGQSFPAKFVFDITTAPSCTNDFVVIGLPTSRTVTSQANLIGLNNLYTNPGGTGFCPGTGPTVMFAYGSGTGQIASSVVLSQNGQQIAYIENLADRSFFHVLTIGTTGTNGSSATSPSVPGFQGGNNAVDLRVLLSPDGGTTTQSSTTSPFIVYTPGDSADVAYATTYSMAAGGSGYLYKISNVFNGGASPTIDWVVPIAAVPSTPVYDRASNTVFFTDSAGRIDSVVDTGNPPTVVYGTVLAPGTTSENPILIDGKHHMLYAFFNSNGTNAIVVQAPTSLASSVSVPVGAANTTYTGPYLPDFNHAWYTGTGSPLMFVAGMDGTGTIPTLYSVEFTAGVMNSTPRSSAPLATGSADASPVSEFYNATLNADYLFVGVTDNCLASNPGGTGGCIMRLDITHGFPSININTTALPATGGPSGIIPDNDSTLPEASSVYYATKSGATLVKATQAGLN